jgi:transposase InsO family protein
LKRRDERRKATNIAAGKITASKQPVNLLRTYIANVPAIALVDSGAAISVLSGDIFSRMRKGNYTVKSTMTHTNLLSADSSPMPVIAEIETEVKIAGLHIPCTFSVVQKLGFQAILGVDFLTDAHAVVNFKNNTLSICDELITVPLVRANDNFIAYTTDAIEVPPFCEAIFNATAKIKRSNETFVVEPSPYARCPQLLVARTIFNANRNIFCCRVCNATDKAIKLAANTPIAMISPVTVHEPNEEPTPIDEDSTLSIAEMRAFLESKEISFKDTAFTGKHLDDLIRLLYRYRDRLAVKLTDLEQSDTLLFRIDTGDALPIRKRGFRRTPQEKEQLREYTRELLDAKIIRPSDSPWSANVLLISKKDTNEKRIVLDYRDLNSKSRLINYPMRDLISVIDELASGPAPQFFFTTDLKSGYWQCGLDPADQDKTAFHIEGLGGYCFTRVPQGVSGAAAHFQRVIEKALMGLPGNTCLAYLDDLIGAAESEEKLLQKLELVLDRFRKSKLKIHPKKSHFGVPEVRFLGHIFDRNGYRIDSSKFSILEQYPVPRNPKEVKRFLGVSGYYRRFLHNYSITTHALRQLLKEDTPFVWTKECQEAFETVKRQLLSAPVLMLPRLEDEYFLEVDACKSGIAWTLNQKDTNGRLRVINYGGRALRGAEINYPITQLECLSLISAIKENHPYLANSPCTAFTDHVSLVFLRTMKLSTNNRLARWSLFLQPYNLKIVHKSGKSNVVPDALSRIDWKQVEQEQAEKSVKSNITTAAIQAAKPERITITFDTAQRDAFVCPLAAINQATLHAQFPTIQDISVALPDCPDFGPLYRFLTTQQLPADEKLARRIVLEARDYIIEDNVLWLLHTPRTKKLDRVYCVSKRLCIPRLFREQIALALHDDVLHAGFSRVFATARLRYYFKDMYPFLRNHVLTCQVCQEAKRPIHADKIPLLPTPIARPFSHWVADIHGPYPESIESENDAQKPKRYVLAFIDQITLWPELVAVSDITAATVIRAMFDHVISRFGVPKNFVLQTDNGSAFIAQLTKAFCDTFGVKQSFSSPYHPQPNSKIEQFADTLHKSIRILTTNQADWSKHLQAIAMSHRAMTTSSTGFSPFEVAFGQPMQLFIDRALLSENTDSPSLRTYMQEVAPKLTLLEQIASENSENSAARHRKYRNIGAKPPSFEVAEQVLLLDTTTKQGQNPKLKRKWTGPFLITEVLDNYNFKLQEMETGRDLKRPVHASRLKRLRQLPNDYREETPDTLRQIFQCKTARKQISVRILVGDILKAATQAIMHPTCVDAAQSNELSQRLWQAVGEGVQQTFRQHIDQQTDNATGHCFITPAGNLHPIRRIAHIVSAFDCATVHSETLNCLRTVDAYQENIASLAIPFFDSPGSNTFWDIAQQYANVVNDFDTPNTDQPGYLTKIDFICQDLTAAGVVQTVFQHTIKMAEQTQPDTDNDKRAVDSPPQATNSQTSDWYEIETVLKRRRLKGGDEFLVKWKNYEQKDWIKRKDLTAAALEEFFRRQPPRKRRVRT